VLAKVPQLDPTLVEDLILGCGQPAGESGYNVARVAALLAGLDDVPGVTVSRYCSSLQTIRMARATSSWPPASRRSAAK
jgi:acetyl-CoA C-acetyltransferase